MQTFDDGLAEFIERSRRLLHQESSEDRPPPHPAPSDPGAVPVPSALILTADLIRRYAYAIGEDNPLYTDPAYGDHTWLGSQIAPPTILIHVRFPADHGAQRPQGYPVANFLSGVAWEFYDVVRPGTRLLLGQHWRADGEGLRTPHPRTGGADGRDPRDAGRAAGRADALRP